MKHIIKILILSAIIIIAGCSEDRIDASGTGKIKGTVVSMGSNEALADVKIETTPASNTVFTNDDGEFEIDGVRQGDYSVQATKDDFVAAFEAAVVTVGNTVNVVFELQGDEALNEGPSTPILISPENNATEIETTVSFEWESTDPDQTDTVMYSLTLINDTNDLVEIYEEIIEPTFELSGLLSNTKYFWQIKADDGINTPVLSELSTFRTVSSATVGDILFVRNINGNNVIISANEDGDEFQLTSQNFNSFKPRRNLAVNKIAFLRSVGGNVQLFTMNNDGSNQVQVTNTFPVNGFNFDEVEFTWKPEGDMLLYPSFDKIFITDPDGGGAELFFTTLDGSLVTELAWSQVNDQIAVKTNNSEGYDVEIFIIDIEGNLLDTILSGMPGAAGGLDFNVSGSRILYTRDVSGEELPGYLIQESRAFIYNRASNEEETLLTGTNIGFNELDPKFSPNGNEIIYVYKGVSAGATPDLRRHVFTVNNVNSEAIVMNGFMPDWEN